MSILDEFDRQRHLYAELSAKMEELLHELLKANSIRVHSVTSRPKDKASFEKKINSTPGKYGALSDVTDLCAARLTTYLADEVDGLANLVETEFGIDRANSVDKRQALDPDQFGYMSVHYVATIKDTRADLPGYRRFRGVKFEIQIRSILQHAWAEIEHDLQYKSADEIPRDLKRRFARLASLLELADAEFVGIRDQIEKYRADLPRAIEASPSLVLVDRDSLRALIQEDNLLRGLDEKIAESVKLPLNDDIPLEQLLKMLNLVGLKTIEAIKAAIEVEVDEILSFSKTVLSAAAFPELSPVRSVNRGVCILYLAYVQVVRGASFPEILQFLDELGARPGTVTDEVAKTFLEFHERVQREKSN
jgi:putative GTP pyrophosphokinase